MSSRSRKIGVAATVLALVGLVAWLALFRSPGFEPPPLPDPNGYDDFVRAGQMLAGASVDFQDATLDELRAIVASNAPALAVLRAGLEKQSCVPVEFTVNESTSWTVSLSSHKALAQALSAEARLELMLNSPEKAAEICVETIQFGIQGCRGGVLIHRLVGYAIEGIGSQTLAGICRDMEAADCRRIMNQLAAVLEQREPLDNVRLTELAWLRRISGARDWVAMVVQTRSLSPFPALVRPIFSRCERLETQSDRLLLDIASRTYELEKGDPPENVHDLVPDYLKSIPIDPATGDPMQLQP